MPNLFYAGQTDYIEKLNTLATTESVTDGSLAASFLSLVVAGLSTFGGGLQVNAQASAPATPASGFTVFSDASHIPGWKGQNGYLVKLNATANTADRTYTLPNASGTFALLGSAQTFSAAQTVSINSASAALTLTQAGAGAALSTNGQIVSTLGTGTAPFSVVSTTLVANLNAALLNGATFAAPGTIGGGTPGAATFTTLTAGLTRVSAADGGITFGVQGTTRGMRVVTSSYGVELAGVDNTLATSYQPLNVVASVLGLYTTGASAIGLGTNSSTPQMYVTNTTGAVNFIQATGAATAGGPVFSVGGSDTNVPFAHYTKGGGTHQFFANGSLQLLVGAVASSVNYWQFFGAATGGALNMYAGGSDTNITVVQNAQGSGGHFFRTAGGTLTQFVVVHAASAVNRYSAQGAPTGIPAFLYADGSDTNVSAGYSLKGAGNHVFYTGSTTAVQAYITHTASAANALIFTGSASGNAVSISTYGTDTDRSITLTAAGTGTVNVSNPLGLKRYTVATLPAATTDRLIIVSDESGGLVPAFSDGTNWRRVTDRAIVS